MPDWIFDGSGSAVLLIDDDCLRNRNGQVVARISGRNVYSLAGFHRGWYEEGVLYDSGNQALGFVRDASGYLPSRPGIGGTPGIPGFAGRPGRPGFSGVPGRPGLSGWSAADLQSYF